MNFFSISGILVGVPCFLLAILALHYGKEKIHWLLSLFNFAVAIWGIGIFLVGTSDSIDQSITAWKTAHIGGFLIAPLFFHFTCEFCGVRHPKLLYLAYGQVLFFLCLSLLTGTVFNETKIVSGIYYNRATPMYTSGILLYSLFATLSFYELIKHWRRSTGRKRLQTSYNILGFIFGFSGGTTTFFPMYDIDFFFAAGNVGITVYVIILSYAIFRHHLLELRVIFQKAVIYFGTVLVLFSLFIPIIYFIDKYLPRYFFVGKNTSYLLLALTISLLFPPIINAVSKVMKNLLRFTVDYAGFSKEVSRKISQKVNSIEILEHIGNSFHRLFAPQFILILSVSNGELAIVFQKGASTRNQIIQTLNQNQLIEILSTCKTIIYKDTFQDTYEPEQQSVIENFFKIKGCELLVPIVIDCQLSNIILLGGKKSKDFYSKTELDLIDSLMSHTATALENAELYEDLEKRVEEKTRKLKRNLELLEANANLREDVERIVRHDMKNPLGIVIGIPQVMRFEKNLTPEQIDNLNTIERTGRKLLNMINLSLTIYKMETGEFNFMPVGVNVIHLIKEIQQDLSGYINLKKTKIEITFDMRPIKESDQFIIPGNENLCYSLFSNLIKNAIEASDIGNSVTINLEAGESLILSIHNQGSVPKEIRSKFFNKYSTSGKSDGTGLGTYSAHLITEGMGGKISMVTSDENGTTIEVSFSKN